MQKTRLWSLGQEDPLDLLGRKWQLTPVFLSGKSQGQRSLVVYRTWGHKRIGCNWERADVQAGYRKDRGTKDHIANICWIIEKARELKKKMYFCFTDNTKAFDCVDHNKLWKILKEMGIPDHLTCFLRNLYAGQEAIIRTGHETTDWFQIGKGVHRGCMLSPCLFNLYVEQSTSCEMPDWMKHKLESRLPGEISITSNMQISNNRTYGRKWRRTKEPLDESKRGE